MFKLRPLRKILGHIEFDGSNTSNILKGTKKGWKSETTKKQLQEHFSNYEDYVIIYIKIFSESGEISVYKGKEHISLLYAHDFQALGTTALKKALFCHRNHCTALPEMYYSQMQVKA